MADRSFTPLARMGLMLATVGLLTGLFLGLRPLQSVHGEFLVFGTRSRIELLTPDRDAAEAALAEVGRLFVHDHRSWHPWEPSDITRLNAALAQGHGYRVPADVADLIRRAQEGYVQTGGLFNAAAGRLIGAWGFHTSRYPVQTAAPSAEAIGDLLAQRPDMGDVHVADDGTVTATHPAVSIDINGLSEGYASAQVAQLLARHGIGQALVYLGGFVMAVGPGDGHRWRVGVNAPDGVLGQVELEGGESLASSGDYQRHRASAADLGHIVDARTGWPQRASAAASVLSDDPVFADIASTALMVAGPGGFQSLADRMQLNCALLLGHDGRLYLTPGMRDRLHTRFPAAEVQIVPRPSSECRRGVPAATVVVPSSF